MKFGNFILIFLFLNRTKQQIQKNFESNTEDDGVNNIINDLENQSVEKLEAKIFLTKQAIQKLKKEIKELKDNDAFSTKFNTDLVDNKVIVEPNLLSNVRASINNSIKNNITTPMDQIINNLEKIKFHAKLENFHRTLQNNRTKDFEALFHTSENHQDEVIGKKLNEIIPQIINHKKDIQLNKLPKYSIRNNFKYKQLEKIKYTDENNFSRNNGPIDLDKLVNKN